MKLAIRHSLICAFATLVLCSPTGAWDGVDVQNGAIVETEKGNLVRSGRDIEIFDHSTGQYHDVSVEDINRSGGTVEIEVYDYTKGEYRTLDFDD